MLATGTHRSGSVAQTESAAAFNLPSTRYGPLKCQAGGSLTYTGLESENRLDLLYVAKANAGGPKHIGSSLVT
jgi:hypothetical protein